MKKNKNTAIPETPVPPQVQYPLEKPDSKNNTKAAKNAAKKK